ncbi:BON domain-containing protein [Ornithinimicrobium tianjinense]|uniref:BON domain-containing protein n=1 Tax=Ornithinimicrobium tianjinense TaxID=1195761 RepID=A0A917BSU0_9MICO|nr:BON domain-containing protein [Ornithinimicrobium tianjinense]GGF55406.1 hypothetical protein GCM10011366_24160 [Ornithinimicrobium tianjinense]
MSDATGWATVTRRYRQRPAGWWWVAVLVVPLLLAGLGLLGGAPAEDGATEQPAPTTSAPPVVVPPPSHDRVDGLPSPFSLTVSDGQLRVAAQVPDETAAKDLLAAVTATAADLQVDDAIEVVDDAVAPAPETLAAAVAAGAAAARDDLEIDWDGTVLTLTGEVDDAEARAEIEDAARAALPVATVDNRLTLVTGE